MLSEEKILSQLGIQGLIALLAEVCQLLELGTIEGLSLELILSELWLLAICLRIL